MQQVFKKFSRWDFSIFFRNYWGIISNLERWTKMKLQIFSSYKFVVVINIILEKLSSWHAVRNWKKWQHKSKQLWLEMTLKVNFLFMLLGIKHKRNKSMTNSYHIYLIWWNDTFNTAFDHLETQIVRIISLTSNMSDLLHFASPFFPSKTLTAHGNYST